MRVKKINQCLNETQKEGLTIVPGQSAKVPPMDEIVKDLLNEDTCYIVERCREHIRSERFV